MNIPPYWVIGRCEMAGMSFRLHGSSETGMDEARARMAQREEVLRRFHEEHSLPLESYRRELSALIAQERGDSYEVEVFEPLLERVSAQSAVTRNRYGAEVLNTTELCFVDVDAFPPGIWERLKSLFGGRLLSDEGRLMAALQGLHAADSTLSARLYRTAGGWRVILAAEGLEPSGTRARRLMERLNADLIYASLCRKQKCWRARLTPKPGRLGVKLGKFPRRTASDTPAEGEEAWLAAYAEAGEGKGVCRLIESYGAAMQYPLVAWHDERTAALKSGLPLA